MLFNAISLRADEGPVVLGQATSLGVNATYGPHAAWLLSSANSGSGGATGGAPGSTTAAGGDQHRIQARTVFAWHQPVSPHIAVETEGAPLNPFCKVEHVHATIQALQLKVHGIRHALHST